MGLNRSRTARCCRRHLAFSGDVWESLSPAWSLSSETPEVEAELAEQIGAAIAKLHASDVVHGDLTTSNMLWKNNRLV